MLTTEQYLKAVVICLFFGAVVCLFISVVVCDIVDAIEEFLLYRLEEKRRQLLLDKLDEERKRLLQRNGDQSTSEAEDGHGMYI